MKEQYNHCKPIYELFDQIINAVNFVKTGSDPYYPEQIVTTAYDPIFQIGLFIDDFELLEKKSFIDKIWIELKQFLYKSTKIYTSFNTHRRLISTLTIQLG